MSIHYKYAIGAFVIAHALEVEFLRKRTMVGLLDRRELLERNLCNGLLGIELNLVAAYIRDAEEHARLMSGEVEWSIQAQALAHARVLEQYRGGKIVRQLDDLFGVNEHRRVGLSTIRQLHTTLQVLSLGCCPWGYE